MDLILDTSYLIGLGHERDAHHEAALEVQSGIDAGHWERTLLHEYVLLETLTVLTARENHGFSIEFGRSLLETQETHLVLGSDLLMETWDAFRTQPTGELSFTDAALTVVAEAYNAPEIATFDRGFEAVDGVRVVPG